MEIKHKYDEDWNSVFEYDESSPSCLRWKEDRFRGRALNQKFISAGEIVGSLNSKDGYWHVHVFGKMYNAHNIVWTMFNGNQGDGHIDHLDRDRSNNKIENLRLVPPEINTRNLSKSKFNKSGVTGVFYRKIYSRHENGKFNEYWFASWRDKTQRSKAFSIGVYGYDIAFQMACEHREKMIMELNERGAGYSPTHGK